VLDPRVKSLNYLNSVLAKREARLRGADEALILNSAGMVAEAAVANVFAFRRGKLLTPPPTDGALEGVTRFAVLELASGLGIPTDERSLSRMDLISADEVFVSGTGARIVGVRSLDGAETAAHAGPDHREAWAFASWPAPTGSRSVVAGTAKAPREVAFARVVRRGARSEAKRAQSTLHDRVAVCSGENACSGPTMQALRASQRSAQAGWVSRTW
jgi:hypothetical protein